MAIRQVRVQVKNFNGQCDTTCSECSTVRGIVARELTVDGVGVLVGRIAPDPQGRTVWTEGCGCFANFEFDDAQLVDPALTVIRTCDICLACGCMVDLILRLQGGAVLPSCAQIQACLDAVDTNTVSMSYVGGVFSADTRLSAQSPNALQANLDGLFVPQFGCVESRGCIGVASSSSINFTYNVGTGIISGSSRISSAPNNQLQSLADGLFVASFGCAESRNCLSSQNTQSIQQLYNPATGVISANCIISSAIGNTLSIVADGLFAAPTSCATIRNCLSSLDTATVDMAYNTATGEIAANVRASATPGNAVVFFPDGIFVPTFGCAQVRNCISVVDTSSLDLSFNIATGEISGVVAVSPNAGNALQDLGNGLFVPIAGVDCAAVRSCLSVADTSSVDFTYNVGTGQFSADTRVSSAPGNSLTVLGDGLFVPVSNINTCADVRSCIGVFDSPTVDLTYTIGVGSISADVRISSNIGNQISALADGLFVPRSAIDSCADVRACLSALDTGSIDMTFNPATGQISADARISAAPGNQATVLGDGIFVPASAINSCADVRGCLSAVDSTSVDVGFNVATGEITASTIISSNAGNQLQSLPNGLFVAPPAIASCAEVRNCLSNLDTPSVDMDYNPVTGQISAAVNISAAPGNAIVSNADGLFVAPASVSCASVRACLSALDSTSVDVGFNVATGEITAATILSPNAGNQLQILPNGLFVARSAIDSCADVRGCLSAVDSTSVDVGFNIATGEITASTIISPNAGNQLQNLANGLFVARSAIDSCADVRGCLSNLDTPSVDMNYNPTTGQISAAVNLSAATGNAIISNVDGLFVPVSNINTCADVRGCLSALDTSSVDTTFNTATGQISSTVIVSPNAGNQLQSLVNGMFVARSAIDSCADVRGCLSAVDSTSIDVGFNVATGEITASAILSAAPGNQLQSLVDGLFVPASAINSCADVRGCLSALDTGTVDMNFSPLTGQISADVILSSTPGNQLQVLVDGLFVPISAINSCADVRACLSALDTSSVDMSFNPATGQISAAVLVDPVANNLLVSGASGLLVSCEAVQDCVGAMLDVTRGLVYNDALNQVSVAISPNPGNGLSQLANGLFVSSTGNPLATLVDNGNRTFTYDNGVNPPTTFCQGIQTLNITDPCQGVGANNMLKSATLSGCTLTLRSAAEIASAAVQAENIVFNNAFPNGGLFNVIPQQPFQQLWHTHPGPSLTITNPSTCRPMRIIGNIRAGAEFGVYADGVVGDSTQASLRLFVDLNGGGFNWVSHMKANDDPTVPFGGANAFAAQYALEMNYFYTALVPPGGSYTVDIEDRIVIQANAPVGFQGGISEHRWRHQIVGYTV